MSAAGVSKAHWLFLAFLSNLPCSPLSMLCLISATLSSFPLPPSPFLRSPSFRRWHWGGVWHAGPGWQWQVESGRSDQQLEGQGGKEVSLRSHGQYPQWWLPLQPCTHVALLWSLPSVCTACHSCAAVCACSISSLYAQTWPLALLRELEHAICHAQT